jgi:hypothetical protein
MFEPLLAQPTWGYAARERELGQISGATWLAARSAPEVMRLRSNPDWASPESDMPLPPNGTWGIR